LAITTVTTPTTPVTARVTIRSVSGTWDNPNHNHEYDSDSEKAQAVTDLFHQSTSLKMMINSSRYPAV